MKLALGTVQFGIDYGLTNHGGRTEPDEARRILDAARAAGIGLLDTAALYGCAEQVLGQCGAADAGWRIVTKTIQFKQDSIGAADADACKQALQSSFTQLRAPSVYGVLVHHAPDLLVPGGERIWEILRQFQQQGRISRIGVSAYDGAVLARVLERYEIDLVQLPMNVLDRRLQADGTLAQLKQRGVEVHVRSAFLQGLLLSEPTTLSPYFAPLQARLAAFGRAAHDAGMSRAGLALAWLRANPCVDQIVMGVNNADQLRDSVRAYHEQLPADVDLSPLRCDDAALVDPSRWPPRTN